MSGQQTAAEVVSMMRRALELQPPLTIPRQLKKGLTQSEIEEYETEYRKEPGLLFFEYPLAASVDRDLYRDLKRWWRSDPHDQLQAAHHLAIEYGAATDPLQTMILQCLEEIDDLALDVPDRARTLEPVWFRILSKATSERVRSAALHRIAGLRTLSEGGFANLLSMAASQGAASTFRADAIRILAGPWQEPGPPRSVDQYLLKVAKGDPCDECRMSAVTYYLAQRTSKDELIPAYTSALADAVREDDARVAQHMMRVLAVQLKVIDAAPALAMALRSSKPPIRASAVNAFEKIAGIPPEEAQKYTGHGVAMMLLDNGLNDEEDLAELDRAVGVWLQWWSERGDALLQKGQRGAFEAEARKVYEHAGNGQPGT